MPKVKWLKFFQTKNNTTIATKPIIPIPKWALRISNEAFKEWKTHQQDNILFFDRAS